MAELTPDATALLTALVAFYQDGGKDSPALCDPVTGGLYAHKLAAQMGLPLGAGDTPPQSFLDAATELTAAGLIVQLTRDPAVPHKGLWPTSAGLAWSPP